MKQACTLIAAVILAVSTGCNTGGGIPSDYARVVVRNGSDTEPVNVEVTNADGEVVLSELLEPNSSTNARTTPGSHTATATVTDADGGEGESFSETFDVDVIAYVTYQSATEDSEAGLSVNAPDTRPDDDGGEEEGEGGEEEEEGGEEEGGGEEEPAEETSAT